jgi:hypothetical protein
MELFAIYIGGSHPQSLIEVHDIRFIVADNLEQTYELLKKSWWGTPKSLHIDAWGILNHADGYDITFEKQEPDTVKKLFYINVGGYDHLQFTELHKNIFVVAEDEKEAKKKALAQIKSWGSGHKDNLYEIDNVLNLALALNVSQDFKMQLTPNNIDTKFEFKCSYLPIARL